MELGKSGNIYSQLAVTGEAFVWDAKQSKNFLLSTWPRETHIIESPRYWSTHRLRPRLAVSPDEKIGVLQQEPIEYSGGRATRLELVDLTDPHFASNQVLEDSYLEKVPRFSPDLQAKSAKSMFEYGTVLYTGNPTSLTEEEELGDAIWDWAWSPDSQKIAYLLQERDKKSDAVSSIRLFDRGTKKHETLFSKQSASELYWPTADTIYFVRGVSSGGCELGSIDVAKKTIQTLIKSGVQRYSLSVSRDGKYIAYSSDQVSTRPEAPFLVLSVSDLLAQVMVTITKDRMLNCEVLNETGVRISGSMYAPNVPPQPTSNGAGECFVFCLLDAPIKRRGRDESKVRLPIWRLGF